MENSNGLLIDEREFMRLKTREQLCCLYKNQVKTLRIIQGYKLYYRITSAVGGILILGLGVLFKMHLGI